MTVDQIIERLKKLQYQWEHDPVYSDNDEWADGVIDGRTWAANDLDYLISEIEGE